MPVGAAARGAPASPGRGPVALGRAMLVLLVLMLSTLWVCGLVPLPEPRLHRGARWVWGVTGPAQAEPPLHSHRKRDDGGQLPSATITTLEHSHAATAMLSGNETGSPEPPAAPSTNAHLHRVLAVPTTSNLQDETDSPDPLLSSTPPAPPGTNASLLRVLAVPTTSNLQDETDSPDPDLLLSSTPPAPPGTNASLLRVLAVPTAEPQDETDPPDPDLLLSSTLPTEPSTHRAPQKGITTIPSWPTAPSEEGRVASGANSSSTTPSVLGATSAGYEEVKKAGATPVPTHSAPWDGDPQATTAPVPWDLDGVMGKCLLVILLLALVAATFMVCTGVLGALLWRRARTARRRLSPTEMICISSLLPEGEVPTNGPKPRPARRQRLLLDGGFEADGDSLTLSSFLPEHS